MNLLEIPSAWKGLENLASWLVHLTRPRVIVDLGVDFGFSTCALAMPGIGNVFGIDQRPVCIEQCSEFSRRLNISNIQLICSTFDAAAATWLHTVDILHIDGDHDYGSVKRDFDAWYPHLKSGGILLLHDIDSFPEGPGRLFSELQWPKWGLHNFSGLGVLTKP